jgi:hypothetical protein
VLRAVARTARGPLAVVDPMAFLSADLLGELDGALSSVARGHAASEGAK